MRPYPGGVPRDARRKGRSIGMQQESCAESSLSRRKILGMVGISAAALGLAACGGAAAASGPSTATGTTSGSGTTPGAAAAANEAWLYLSVALVKQAGDDWPEFVPSNFTVPANSTVHVEIRNFDDGPGTIPSGYEKVHGTVDGSMTLIPSVAGDLSSAQPQTVQSVDPKNVAHTLTMSDIGLSIPLPPVSTVRFTFKTGAAGTHTWQCMAACGTGDSGWAGPMATAGYMQGKMIVQA